MSVQTETNFRHKIRQYFEKNRPEQFDKYKYYVDIKKLFMEYNINLNDLIVLEVQFEKMYNLLY
jgi:hypothetical protein